MVTMVPIVTVCWSLASEYNLYLFQLLDVSYSVLCPRSQKAEERELVLKVVCGILTFLIILTISKLLYDYWNYRQRGKLPWIVYRMP